MVRDGIRPPPPLLPFSSVEALTNILASLLLQMMKATALAESSFIFSSGSICYEDVYRRESSRCRTFPFFSKYFLSFHLSRFSFYFNILQEMVCNTMHHLLKYTIKNVKKKGRVRHLLDSRLQTSPQRRKPGENRKYKIELSANTVAFISCRHNVQPQCWLKAPHISSFLELSLLL